MEILYILIPVAILLVIAMIAGFLWAVKSGQFDDLEGPAHRILMDKDDVQESRRRHESDAQRVSAGKKPGREITEKNGK